MAVIDVSGGRVIQALVVTMVVIVLDNRAALPFQVAGQVVVFQRNTVLHGLVPPFDFALGLRVVRGATKVIHALAVEVIRQIGRPVRRAVIAEQPRLMDDGRAVAARSVQRQLPSANSGVSVTSTAFILVQSFQAMM